MADPVIAASRAPVAIVVGSLAGGTRYKEVQEAYGLRIEDSHAALEFAVATG